MPPAIAAVVAGAISSAAATAGATLATQALISTVATWVVGTAITVGTSIAANALLAGRPQVPRPSDGQQEFQQAIPPRVFHYGRVKVSGPLALYEVHADDLWKIVLISAREIDAYEQIFLDDNVVTKGSSGNVGSQITDSSVPDSDLYNDPRVGLYTGTDGQTAEIDLIAKFPSRWTSEHRLRGVAYVILGFDTPSNPADFSERYPNGVPSLKVLIRGNKVYDPRLDSTVSGGSGPHRHNNKGTWEWSENAALCTLDYLTHEDGYNQPITKMDLPSWMAKADLDDEPVTLKAGGAEPRYRVATTVYLNEARKSVLARLLEAADARLHPTNDGKIAIRGGEWVTPTTALNADVGHIIEAEFSDGMPKPSRYNELAIRYMSPAHDYTEVEGDPWQDAALVTDMGGVVETRPFDVLQVPSHGQARRLAKIRMARDNPRWVGEIRTNFYGLDAVGEDVVSLAWSELDEPESNFDGPFWLEGDLTMMSDGTGVSARVRSASPASYSWDAATEEGTAPLVPGVVLQVYNFGAGGTDDLGAGGTDKLGAGT